MKKIIYAVMVGLTIGGCSYHVYDEPYPNIFEAEKSQVNDCTSLGVLSETANAANPWSLAAKHNMVFRVRERAGQLGATHIVWLHKTATMATAQVYQCP